MPVSAQARAPDRCRPPKSTIRAELAAWQVEIQALAVVVVPVVFLTWKEGGVDRFDQTVVFGWVLLAAGALCLRSKGPGVTPSVPWAAAVTAVIPLLQIIPPADLQCHLVSAFRLDVMAAAESLGVIAPTTLSIAPGKTISTLLSVAGCCALFVTARAFAARSERAFWLIAVAFMTLGVASAFWGLEQFLRERLLFDGTGLGAHGSFVNKNHYAALMEACLGLAIGATLAGLAARRDTPLSGVRTGLLSLTGILVGVTCFSVGLLSHSRAGAAMMALTAGAGVALAMREHRRAARGPVVVAAATLAVAAGLGWGGLAERFEELTGAGGLPTRAAIWADTVRSAGDYWLTGAGVGTFPYAFRRSSFYLPQRTVDHAHSDYLEWLLEFGLLPTLLLTGAMAVTLWRVARFVLGSSDARRRMAAAGALLGAGAILLHATVDFPLQIPALAALTAVLLGCAAGLARPKAAAASLPPWIAAAGCWGLCTVGLLSAGNLLPSGDTEAVFREGQRALLDGRAAAADTAFRAAAASNPQAAAIWLKRAESARLARRESEAVAAAELAARFEPFTLRTEWTLAQAYLGVGNTEAATSPLAGLADALPKMRRAVFHAASSGGMAANRIAAEVVPSEPRAAVDYLVYLADRWQWGDLATAARILVRRVELTDQVLRPVYDRLWDSDQARVAKQVWKEIQSGRTAVDCTPAGKDTDDLVRGGPGWMVRGREGVLVTVRNAGLPAESVEVRFQPTADADYRHLTRDFFVNPETDYLLRAEVRAANLTPKDGPRLVLAAPKRFIASSSSIGGTTTWVSVSLRFRTLPDEHVVRLAVVNDPSGHPNETLRGRLEVRRVTLRRAP